MADDPKPIQVPAPAGNPNDAAGQNLKATDERPPKAMPGTPSKPKASVHDMPSTGSFPNALNTQGLTPAQRARVEGTVLDGQNGGAVLGTGSGVEPFRPKRNEAPFAGRIPGVDDADEDDGKD